MAGLDGPGFGQQRGEVTHGRSGIPTGERQLARAQRSRGARGRLVERIDERAVLRPTPAHGLQVAERDRPADRAAELQRLVHARTHGIAPPHHLLAEPAGASVQAEFGVGDRQVADHDRATERVVGALVGLRRLLMHDDAIGDVAAAETRHVEGVAQAECVARLARQIERPLRRRARQVVVRSARIRETDQPLGAALADRITR